MTKVSKLGGAAIVAAACVAAAGLGGCDKELMTENPPQILVVDNLYTSKAGFQQALNALYAQVRNERLGSSDDANSLRAAMSSVGTDAAWSPFRDPNMDVYQNYGLFDHSQRDEFKDAWSWLYKTINGANTIIDRSANPDIKWTAAEKDEIVGEARLFRAWAYRHLTYLFGDVPLNLEESKGTNIRTDWERSPRAAVQKQIEQDLLFAEANLPATASDGRLTRAVASHYLAELYLWMGDAVKAEAEARKVTDSGLYKLVTARYGVQSGQPGTPFTDMFLDGNVQRSQGNTEALWTLNYEANMPGGGASIMRRYWVNRYYNIKGVAVTTEYGGRGLGRIAPTAYALKLYAATDDRGSKYAIRKFYQYNDAPNVPKGKAVGDTVFLNSSTEKLSDANWVSTRKWDGVNPLDVQGNYNVQDQTYLRLAETYLLLAEAQLKQGKTTEAAATINLLRNRAHAPVVTAADVTLDLILDERARELLSEEQRRYTLLRTGTLLTRVAKYNPMSAKVIAAKDTLFPVPQVVLDANIGHPMPQNPGF